ncbi:unknown protein [Nostoc sp. NIES-3756]|uniref:hypothetical protein n=1 Tax=Nostoc sp. NIES-3756 TaxID=1751286 RepID=UPI00071F80B0|nr:hypothetical protein [Nostoc sp. NIES-3756]BAT53763.1 unknown protein [Nostoc sp. NIES-3756]
MNHFDIPSARTWLRFFGWVAVKLIVSLVQFCLLLVQKFLEFLLWCVNQTHKPMGKIAFVIDHMPYAGIPLTAMRQADGLQAIEVPALPASIEIQFFDFSEFRNQPDKFPHIRVIGKTGVGKTRFTEWLMDLLGGEQFVITPKKKPTDWLNHKVFGYPFNYEQCEQKLKDVHSLMHRRYAEMEDGISHNQINFACDEWKLINKNVTTAKEVMKDIIIVARDAKIRLVALAQGENVATWGLEGESDLEECFTTVRFGDFALDYCKGLRNQYRKDSDEYLYYSAVLNELVSQGFRCCMVDRQPARVPDLSNWKPGSLPVVAGRMDSNYSVVDQLQSQLQAESQKPEKTTQNQGFQPETTATGGAISDPRTAVKSALDAGRSVDWCAKNIPGLPGNYYSARALIEEWIQKDSQN